MEIIRVGPYFYQVVLKPEKEISTTPNVITHGQTRPDLSEIWLNENNGSREIHFVTLWHEVVHCIQDTYGLKLSENAVVALASAICQVLQDNPDLNWSNYDAATKLD